MVVAFGTMFNNIRLVRYNKAGTVEIERITVPLSYATKEKFYSRITQDPNLAKEVQITLPRMSFELSAITYDPLRKRSSHVQDFGLSGGNTRRVVSSPYNFDFTLNIYVRNTEDGTQIIEQILPYFSPDYTLTADFIGLTGLNIDVPIVLNSVSYDVTNDTGRSEDLRMIVWTLSFTMKGYMYTRISGDGAGGLIRKVVANTYLMNTQTSIRKKVNFSAGFGTYKEGELIYSGRTLEAANVTAFVESWDPVANSLYIYDIDGVIAANTKLIGAVSNAAWTISSFDASELQVVELTVQPNPLSANANNDFGFTVTIEEFPNIT